jgi:hypothetical protein
MNLTIFFLFSEDMIWSDDSLDKQYHALWPHSSNLKSNWIWLRKQCMTPLNWLPLPGIPTKREENEFPLPFSLSFCSNLINFEMQIKNSKV